MRNKRNIQSSLSPARRGALTILQAVLNRDRFASREIDLYLKSQPLSPEDRGLLTQLVYGVLRRKGSLDRILFSLLKKGSPDFLIQGLRLGLYQLLFLEKVPDHAVLFETVEGIKHRGGNKLGGVANAILREVQREKQRWLTEIDSEEKAGLDFPPWLWARWEQRYGSDRARRLAQYFNQTPVLWARVSEKTRPGVDPFQQIASGQYDHATTEVAAGRLSLQDPHSYEVVLQLDPQEGERGLDACAGHGGKASAIAQILGGEGDFSVFDASAAKLKELKENFNRLKLTIPNIIHKNHNSAVGPFDWILLDAPCSGLGTLGRKPEIRWRTEEKELQRYQKIQLGLLREWALRVKKGGRILYSVCSLEPEEGSEVIEKFLQAHPDWEKSGAAVLWPGDRGEDGFFWGRLIRKI